jgi:hypothetical protein
MKQNTTIAPTMAAADTAPEPSKSMDPASMKLLSNPMTASSTKNATSESPNSKNASRYAPHRARKEVFEESASAGSADTVSAIGRSLCVSTSQEAARNRRRTNHAHRPETSSKTQLERIWTSPGNGDSTEETTTFSNMPSAICTTMELGRLAESTSIQNSDSMTLPAPYSKPGTSSARSGGSDKTTPSNAARFPANNNAVGSTYGMVFALRRPVQARVTATAEHTMMEHATTTLKNRSGTNMKGAFTNAYAER